MTDPSYVLLTGATGLLGRFLLRDLSAMGRKVAVLVRESTTKTSLEKIENILQEWKTISGSEPASPVVITGELTKPDLGIEASTKAWIANNIGEVLHSAASLSFSFKSKSNEPFATNVEGTRHLLDFCKLTGIRRFHHVSTAYVCGNRTGKILESELDVGQSPSNVYEQSKIEAELLVRSSGFIEPPTIFRPSIVVGDFLDGFTSSFHGFYAPLKFVHAFAPSFAEASLEPGAILDLFGLQGNEKKNFVPVDWVSAVITRILLNPSLHGRTYHLSSETPTPLDLVSKVFESILGNIADKTTDNPSTQATKRIPPENLFTMFRENMEPYRCYWREDPIFDNRNIRSVTQGMSAPQLDEAALVRLSQFAINQKFQWPPLRNKTTSNQ